MKRTITLTDKDLEFINEATDSQILVTMSLLKKRLEGEDVVSGTSTATIYGKLDVLTRPVKTPTLGTAEMCQICADRLNGLIGTKFKPNAQSMKSHVSARLREGYTKEDFLEVIDKKVAEWGSDDRMRMYLRPETLFGPKFESYLNQPSPNAGNFSNADYTEGLQK